MNLVRIKYLLTPKIHEGVSHDGRSAVIDAKGTVEVLAQPAEGENVYQVVERVANKLRLSGRYMSTKTDPGAPDDQTVDWHVYLGQDPVRVERQAVVVAETLDEVQTGYTVEELEAMLEAAKVKRGRHESGS